MARKLFKCSKCDRRFSMAAHLTRHVHAIHKKTKWKAAKKKPRAPRVGRPKLTKKIRRRKGRAVAARRPTSDVVARLLTQVRALRAALVAQRRALDGQINATQRAENALRRA